MMRLHLKILAAAVSVSLLLTACSSTNPEAEANAQAPQAQTETAETGGGNKTDENSQRAGNIQRPDLFGRVKSIIGNEVVLELAEMPNREEGQQSNRSGTGGQQAFTGGGGGAPNPEAMRAAAGAMQLKTTGETKTILIPVGVPITSRSRSQETQLDIGDIYEGALLQIWFDENDKEMITRVTVMQGRG